MIVPRSMFLCGNVRLIEPKYAFETPEDLQPTSAQGYTDGVHSP